MTISAHSSLTATFSAVVSASDTADVVNTASITTGPCIGENTCSSTVTNPVPNFSVNKTDVPGDTNPVVPGSTIPYTVVISNTGNGAGSGVLTDTLPSNLTLASSPAPACPATSPQSCSIGVNGQVLTFNVTISAHSSLTATFSAVVSASDTADVVNTASITTGPCNGENTCSSTVTNPVPNFSVHKTDVPGDTNPVVPGSTVPYTVVISNTGNGAGSGVVTDTLPSNLTLASSPAPACPATSPQSCSIGVNGQVLTFNVTISAHSSLTATFSAVVSASDTADVVNTASITTGPCNGENTCSSTVTNPVPNFSVHKTDVPGDGATVLPGSTIPYTVVISNVGNGAGSAVITDTLPSNLTISGSPNCVTTGTVGDDCTVANPSGSTWTFSVTLAAGDTATATFSAVVSASDTTDVVNTAAITTGPCNQPSQVTSGARAHDTTVTCSSTVTNPVPVLSVVKSSTPASGSTVALGSTVTYGLTLTNSGTADATGITVTDAIPNGTTYVASSASCGGAPGCSVTEANNTVTWTGITVHPGTANAVALSFQVTVNSNDTNGEVIPNFAVFTNVGTPGCTTATCDTNTVTVTVLIPASAPAVVTPPPPATAPAVVAAAPIAFTGADIAGMVVAGLAFLGLGASLVMLARRRRRAGETA